GQLHPGPSGIESLLVLVRETALPRDTNLPALFAGLPRQKGLLDPQAQASFENGELVPDDRDRGPPVGVRQGDSSNDPVMAAQAFLRKRLRLLFPSTRAVCFAFQRD